MGEDEDVCQERGGNVSGDCEGNGGGGGERVIVSHRLLSTRVELSVRIQDVQRSGDLEILCRLSTVGVICYVEPVRYSRLVPCTCRRLFCKVCIVGVSYYERHCLLLERKGFQSKCFI
ncbi:hypothetical protein BaRGS_00038721 [Batillaria attramentaria]|uniref:IBR domain-containing protein n=1 Tax=Batillaria attramentaria TaxID=370345 RepID=A0ABD0J513_9CAEN